MHQEIQRSLEILKSGQLLLYPSDTIWGLGCDATNEGAVSKIFSIKQRDDTKSLIVLVSNDSMLNKYVSEVPSVAWDIIDFSELPTTIIYEKAKNLPHTAPDGSIGIRMVKQGFCHELIKKFGKPIISTSANISNEPFPKKFSEINPLILEQVNYAVNLEREEIKNKPSSIIKIASNGAFKIIRK